MVVWEITGKVQTMEDRKRKETKLWRRRTSRCRGIINNPKDQTLKGKDTKTSALN
jgi:hypothetical protein